MIHNQVVVQLRGGLGNQLFGFFAGLSLAEKNDYTLVLDGRLIRFGSNPTRKLELNLIDLSEIKIPLKILPAIPVPTSQVGRKLSRPLLSIVATLLKRNFPIHVIGDQDDLESHALGSDILLDGYFSTFSHYEKWVRSNSRFIFQPKTRSEIYKRSEKEVKNYTGIHIRLGDYLNHPDIYPIPTPLYYEEAIILLNCEDNYVVFCEEYHEAASYFDSILQNAKQIFTKTDFDAVETMSLMANCKNLITANSTFSQWGGKFIKSQGGEVIYPSKFIKNSPVNADVNDWIKLDIYTGSRVP